MKHKITASSVLLMARNTVYFSGVIGHLSYLISLLQCKKIRTIYRSPCSVYVLLCVFVRACVPACVSVSMCVCVYVFFSIAVESLELFYLIFIHI